MSSSAADENETRTNDQLEENSLGGADQAVEGDQRGEPGKSADEDPSASSNKHHDIDSKPAGHGENELEGPPKESQSEENVDGYDEQRSIEERGSDGEHGIAGSVAGKDEAGRPESQVATHKERHIPAELTHDEKPQKSFREKANQPSWMDRRQEEGATQNNQLSAHNRRRNRKTDFASPVYHGYDDQSEMQSQGYGKMQPISQEPQKSDSGKNPLKLRLDLNLEVEIQLTAKIHGDLTLSLLDM